MLTVDESAYWTMLGTWFTGLATFGAVVTSLYFGFRIPKPKLKIVVGERDIITAGVSSSIEHGISIHITNHSLQTAVIEKIVWKMKNNRWLFQQFGDQLSETLPKKIEYGQGCNLWIKTSLLGDEPLQDGNWFVDVAQALHKYNAKPKQLKCYVITSTGQKFNAKPEKSIVARLNEEIKNMVNNQ
ncbi:TPA: hypothetical protein ACYRTT_000698 [Escherichia coli]|uniref:hypothetical protein n=1 Tax=Escherichia coli TaxID=562 RepID=UPI000BE26217|nr:hypothetical protein [Escherichia coli]EFC1954644.1 hypothetical protein [Escherichia coli]EFJ3221779.1 hypothetical protein [Escherichia coli]HBN7449452.1 hypothetical protein [Escherichia coli]